jgi:hypothetical protein
MDSIHTPLALPWRATVPAADNKKKKKKTKKIKKGHAGRGGAGGGCTSVYRTSLPQEVVGSIERSAETAGFNWLKHYSSPNFSCCWHDGRSSRR